MKKLDLSIRRNISAIKDEMSTKIYVDLHGKQYLFLLILMSEYL